MRSEWREVTIADIAEKIAMGPFGSNIKVETFVNKGVPIISGAHLKHARLEELDYNYITEEHAQKLKNSLVYPGDIIFTHAGNVGQVAMIPYDSQYEEYIISQRQFYLRCNKDLALPEFITYFFHSPIGQHKLLANVSQVGVPSIAQPSSYLKTIKLSLPPLPEQRAIAETLSCLDEKIELNNRINTNLEAQAQAIFKSWYIDFEPFQDCVFVDSELGLIPKGWRVGRFTEVVYVSGGGTPKTGNPKYWNGNIPFFTPKDVNGVYSLFTEKYITIDGLNCCNSKLYPINTVFITARGTVGKIALAGTEMAMNQSCYALTGKEGYGQLFVYGLAQKVVESLKHKSSGAVFDAIVTRDFDSEVIIIPPVDIIEQFCRIVEPIFNTILQNTKQSHTLAAIRNALLPKLISGEIRMSI